MISMQDLHGPDVHCSPCSGGLLKTAYAYGVAARSDAVLRSHNHLSKSASHCEARKKTREWALDLPMSNSQRCKRTVHRPSAFMFCCCWFMASLSGGAGNQAFKDLFDPQQSPDGPRHLLINNVPDVVPKVRLAGSSLTCGAQSQVQNLGAGGAPRHCSPMVVCKSLLADAHPCVPSMRSSSVTLSWAQAALLPGNAVIAHTGRAT